MANRGLHRPAVAMLAAARAAASIAVSTANAEPDAATSTPAAAVARVASGADDSSPRKTSPYHATRLTPKAQTYYMAAWGVDRMKVSATSSGNLIRFSYRVTDPVRAQALADKRSPPYLVGQKNKVVLQVPVMEKIGPLRQTAAPKVGQEYWMVFSNKGHPIQPGDRVNVMIGSFHAEGLVVE